MNKQHKWHKEIKAWADGAEIEFRDVPKDDWKDCGKFGIGIPTWDEHKEYRIKPQPKEFDPEDFDVKKFMKALKKVSEISKEKWEQMWAEAINKVLNESKPQPKEPQYKKLSEYIDEFVLKDGDERQSLQGEKDE